MTKCLTKAFNSASSCRPMCYVYHSRKCKPKNLWFDNKCYKEKKKVHQLLNLYTVTRNLYDKLEYINKRREYMRLIKQKKIIHDTKIANRLKSSITDTKLFWYYVKKLYKRPQIKPVISTQEWSDHFYSVFNVNLSTIEDDVDVPEILVVQSALVLF